MGPVSSSRGDASDRRLLRFGIFEFNLTAGTLSRSGRDVSLQQQPAMLLGILLQRAGRIVTRDELREAIWPTGTFVEFDLSLNTAISRLRRILNDSATEPRFIETVPKQGYRFIAPIEYVFPASSTLGPELVGVAREPAAPVEPPPAQTKRFVPWLAGVLVIAVVTVAASVYLLRRNSPSSDGPLMRFTLSMPPGHHITMFELSPQGNQIVYQRGDAPEEKIYRRYLSEEQSRAIPGSERGQQPFFSPNGQEVGFYTPDTLRIVTESGHRDLTAVKPGFGLRRAIWGDDGFIYFTSVASTPAETSGKSETSGIFRIPAKGGKPELLLPFQQLEKGSTVYFGQQVFDNAKALLYSTNTGPLRRSIEFLKLDNPSAPATRLIEQGMGGQILPTGHLLYSWNGKLLAVPFDESARQRKGAAVEVLGNVATNAWRGPLASVSRNGTLAYLPRTPQTRHLVWVDLSGKESTLPVPPAEYEQAEVSPDGTKLLIVRREDASRWTVSVYALQSNSWTPLAETIVPRPRAIWAPDGQSVYASLARGTEEFVNLYHIPLNDPVNPQRLLEEPDFGQFPLSVSANALLYVEGVRPDTQSDIKLLPLTPNAKPQSLVATSAPDRSPAFSPDGRRFAYSTLWQSGPQVWVQSLPSGKPIQVGTGIDPLWSRDGKTLFFLGPGNSLMATTLDSPAKQVLPPGFALDQDWWTRSYSLAPDGRFLVIRDLKPPADQIHIVVHWFQELQRLAPQ